MRKTVRVGKNSVYLMTDRNERRYFSGVDVAEGYLIVGTESVYFTDARYYSAVCEKLNKSDIRSLLFGGFVDIKKYLTEKGIKKVYIDFDKETVSFYKTLKALGVKVADGKKAIAKAVAKKDNKELDCIKKACVIAENAVKKAFLSVKDGVTESELREIIVKYYLDNGAEGESFDTIVAFGANSAIPHHETGETELKEGDVILIDTGCKVNGYCSDITRTAVYKKASKEFTDRYDLVLKANLLAEENITDKTDTFNADKIARDVFAEKGLGEYFTHSLGHGVGLEIHEYPSLSKRTADKLKNGYVFTVEPGLYFDGQYGIRIEDTVTLKNGKLERLYRDGKELMIL